MAKVLLAALGVTTSFLYLLIDGVSHAVANFSHNFEELQNYRFEE
jgi:hypothetical protein